MTSVDAVLACKGLPANLDAERFVLGAILLDDTHFEKVAASLSPDDFHLDKHRRIFHRMVDLHECGEHIDRVTLANELKRRDQLELVDGVSYLIELDNGLPQLFRVDSYIGIVKEHSDRRKLIYKLRELENRLLTGAEHSSEILADLQRNLPDLAPRQENGFVNAIDIVKSYPGEPGGINGFLYRKAGTLRGISTGLTGLDEMTSGLQPGVLYCLAGRSSMGKTALALNIAGNVATAKTDPRSVAFFSLEMPRLDVLDRLACSEARVSLKKFRNGDITREERNRVTAHTLELEGVRLFIDDTSTLGLMDMHMKLRRLRAERGLDLVVVDYLQLIHSGRSKKQENRTQEVGAFARTLKLLAKELNVPVIMLSQLSRAPEKESRRPKLSDLRDSGEIEQHSDVVAFVYREEYYNRNDERVKGKAELIIAKQRNGGTGTVYLKWHPEFTLFEGEQ